ncbi:RNA-directed DNA polymerase from mobile element jockey [Trichonephila clavipes]|nr:RNA-directed DNA polymerase from mobile element jockey [Trichonephila clavipes]
MKYRARKAWQITGCPQDKRTLNRLQNKIHTIVIALTNITWENSLNSLSDEDFSLWGISKALRKKRAPVSALKGPNNIALSDFDKAEYLACSLKTQIQDNDIINETTDNLTNRIVENYFLNKNNFDDHPLTPPKPSELLVYIKKIKIKKSPWREAITNKMVKNLTLPAIFQLTNVIHNIPLTGHFPNSWKTAVIIPILKPGKPPAVLILIVQSAYYQF